MTEPHHSQPRPSQTSLRLETLAGNIKAWARDLGFSHAAICDVDLSQTEQQLARWLQKKYHGEMAYLAHHGIKRTRPAELVAGTVRVITVRIDYLNEPMNDAWNTLDDPNTGYISRYALGRDYHKVVRKRLQSLANKIVDDYGQSGYRAFCDSAPVMEKALAQKSGQGWVGKHTNIINQNDGSWFFLGELYTDIPLPVDPPTSAHCGSCTACIDVCPTNAIVAPYELDARKCISYLTIELKGTIPLAFRKSLGNRIYGCDDCQLVCPWNRYAKLSVEADFQTRHSLNNSSLISLFEWTESQFFRYTEGSAIRRIGHESWLRNIAVALGNAPYSLDIIDALARQQHHPSAVVREHIIWALEQQTAKSQPSCPPESPTI